MDPKASAKSKRSHTLHGRRAHQQHRPPPPSTAATTSGEHNPADSSQQKQQRRRPQPPKPSLPSNWDRYEDEADEEQAQASALTAATPKPKSKGADFAFLLQQAREATRSPPRFDDAVPDFIRSLSPFAFERGRSLLLSCGDDNFIVDDEVSSNFEVPFLSMDLNALGSQLEKLSLSRRLFIDADYLGEDPPDGSYANITSEKLSEEAESKSGNDSKVGQVDREPSITPDVVDIGATKMSSPPIHRPAGSSTVTSFTEDYVKSIENLGFMLPTDSRSAPGSILDRPTGFEVSTAEAELDMLLNSLSEIKLANPSTTEKPSYNPSSDRELGGRGSSATVGISPLRQGTGTSTTLFRQTATAGNLVSGSDLSRYTSKSADQGHISTGFLDDTIDDLLMQTSMDRSKQQSPSLSKQEAGNRAVNISQALDDLDSLLDGF